MSEQLPEGRPRRGRRDPELEVALEAADEREGMEPEGFVYNVLDEGDSVMARMTLQHPTPAGDGWFTAGATTSVRPDEGDSEAALRLYEHVAESVYSMIDDTVETLEKAQAEKKAAAREARRSNRITPAQD